MGPPTPQTSALQTFLHDHQQKGSPTHDPHLQTLALQVAHNLRYQHGWEDVRIHYSSESAEGSVLPRPMISGLPKGRLYTHPDEQIELLEAQKKRREGVKDGEGKVEGLKVESEREWVLPSHLREKWSLRRFGEMFDVIPPIPVSSDGVDLFEEKTNGWTEKDDTKGTDARVNGESGENPWREKLPKRLLLATLDDDSTVVYYIVHDGIVKPRQN